MLRDLGRLFAMLVLHCVQVQARPSGARNPDVDDPTYRYRG